jgi:hypothetical protein
LDGLFFPTHPTAQITHPQISTTFDPSKIPNVEKGLGVITRLLKE